MPSVPLDAVGVGNVMASEVEAVQVGFVTFHIPPGPLVQLGTMPAVHVIALSFVLNWWPLWCVRESPATIMHILVLTDSQ